MSLPAWLNPSSRLHKADFLEGIRVLPEELTGLRYGIQVWVPNHRLVQPVKPFRRAWSGGLLRRMQRVPAESCGSASVAMVCLTGIYTFSLDIIIRFVRENTQC